MHLSRSIHQNQSRQPPEEHEPDPARHSVSTRSPEVPVDDNDGDEDRHDVHDEGEQQVLGDQWDVDRGRRKDLGDEQEEDDEGEQDRDAHGHLLTGIGGQVEDGDGEE